MSDIREKKQKWREWGIPWLKKLGPRGEQILANLLPQTDAYNINL